MPTPGISTSNEPPFSIETAKYLAQVSPDALTELALSLGKMRDAKSLKMIFHAGLLDVRGRAEKLVEAVIPLVETGKKFEQSVASEWIRYCVDESPDCAGAALTSVTRHSSDSPERCAGNAPDVMLAAGVDPMRPSRGCRLDVSPAGFFEKSAPIASMLWALDNLKVEQLQRKGLLPLCNKHIPIVGQNADDTENFWYRRKINLLEYSLICGHPTAMDRALLLLDTNSPAIRREMADSLGNYLESIRLYAKLPAEKELLKICDLINAGVDFEHRSDLVSRRFCEGKNLPLIICDSINRGSQIEESLTQALGKMLDSPRADVNVADDYGNTMLGYAVGRQDPKLVEYLLEKGANMDLADERGDTPLTTAKQQKDTTILQMLQAWRAQTAIKSTIDKVLKDSRKIGP